jgi:predicted dehydrogenase
MSSSMRPLRFGLAGTGYWAAIAHAPALASTPGVQLAAVWGRNQQAAGDLAARHGATAHQDFGSFLAEVDAVAFAVPPDVQCELAGRAARAGKHLMLEKPVAFSLADADALVQAVDEAGVASVVFFTSLFQPDVRTWLGEILADAGGWLGGSAVWLGTALEGDNPFNTPWRREKGALWDLAPHLIALLWKALGPVESVTADHGPADVTHLVLHHRGGPSSTATVTLSAPAAAAYLDLFLWGASGRSAAPREAGDVAGPLRVALSELAANARSGQLDHACDVRFGRDVTRVIAEAGSRLAVS